MSAVTHPSKAKTISGHRRKGRAFGTDTHFLSASLSVCVSDPALNNEATVRKERAAKTQSNVPVKHV